MNNPASSRPSHCRHAVLVDDDPLMREMLADLLRDSGVTRVSAAADGNAALALLQQPGVAADLVVCDLHMPQCDGFEFMEKLAARQFAGKVLLVSGMNARTMHSAELMARFHRLNIVGSLTKPPARADIAAAIGA
jgi:CheY-like chemotaxis protein